MGTDIVPLSNDNPKGLPGSKVLVLGSANAGTVGAIVANTEVLDLGGYFTSIIQGQGLDPSDPNTMSLYKRLSEMDKFLGSSADFPHARVQEVFNGLTTQQERIKYMEGLLLRLSLSLQSLNDSLINFVRLTSSGESREILIGNPNQPGFKPKIEIKDLRKMLHLVTTNVAEGEQSHDNSFRPVNVLGYVDLYGIISKDSKLTFSIGDDSGASGNRWKFGDQRWREQNYLRIGYGGYSGIERREGWGRVVAPGEALIGVSDVHGKTLIYDQILSKIRVLLLQLGDIGLLFNTARENDLKKGAGSPPRITF